MDKAFQDELVKEAMSLGAMDATGFSIDDIAFDTRTLLKCLYGCPGGFYFCPTSKDGVTVKDYMEMAGRYKWGVLVCTEDLKKGQDITLALESKAYLKGHYFAFAATECAVCHECSAIDGGKCRDKHKQRLPLYAFGIDVYKTVANVGWSLEVVQKKGDPRKNITALFVE